MDDDGGVAETSSLSVKQEMVLSLLSVFSGSLSVYGSSLIVYKVFINRTKATPYDRLMFGLSFCDIFASISFACSPFLVPADTSDRIWASGTDATCSLLGFLTQFSLAALTYNMMLSFYYLLTVRFQVKREVFAKRYEFWMHFGTLFYFTVTAISGAAIGLYSEFDLGFGCWVNNYPEGCLETESCISQYIGWAFGGVPTLLTFLSLLVNNVVIYCHVRKAFARTRDDSSESERVATQNLQIREVTSQGFLYVGTFLLCYTPTFVVRSMEGIGYSVQDEAAMFPVLVLYSGFLPLQGFFNLFVYTRPNYVRVRAVYPELSILFSIRKACFDSDIPRLTDWRASMRSKTLSKPYEKHLPIVGSSGAAFSSDLPGIPEENGSEGDSEEPTDDECVNFSSLNVSASFFPTTSTREYDVSSMKESDTSQDNKFLSGTRESSLAEEAAGIDEVMSKKYSVDDDSESPSYKQSWNRALTAKKWEPGI